MGKTKIGPASYCTSLMGARQKFDFPVDGSSTVTWQLY
jgi:hypothetical protein